MEETYINFVKKDDPTDVFTVIADNDKEAIRLIKMYVSQGYEFDF